MKTETKVEHTPGPWEWYTSNSYRRLGTAGEYRELLWGVTYSDGQLGVEWANDADAKLIAAAPDLLEALKGLLAAYTKHLHSHEDGVAHAGTVAAWEDIAIDAIRKAEGDDR